MLIHCLNLLLMYRLEEFPCDVELISPFRSFDFVGNKRIVLKIAGHCHVLTATWLGRELVTGREGCLSRSSKKKR